MDSLETTRAIVNEGMIRAKLLIHLVAIAWGVFFFNLLLAGNLNRLGIRPRTLIGLLGIPLRAFLHSDALHLGGNTGFFLVLGGLLLLRGVTDFVIVSLVALVAGGLGVWIVARDAIHIGASGVIFGYLGFLLLRGYFEHSVLAALLTVLMLGFYSRFLWGIFPTEDGVSWEGHLFGLMGGGLAAYYLDRIQTALALH